MTGRAVSFTAAELAGLGKDNIPPELLSGQGLVYSSPATLAYNSPGAEGFGVKRAGLSVPESVMLILAPGCCGRNTSLISNMPGYKNRFFYLEMNEADLVTGKHLSRVPEAVCEVCAFAGEIRGKAPRVVMICITCVDALLGTDMERVCRKAEEALRQNGFSDTRVRPCYMYALTREGRRPPMVHVRQTLYSLLEPMDKDPGSVNIVGNFAPLAEGELQKYLRKAGVRNIRQIGTCESYDEFLKMASANFNIVTDAEARAACEDMNTVLNIPYIELTRVHGIDKIALQYQAFASAAGITIDDSEDKSLALEAVEDLRRTFSDLTFNIGESSNCNPFELAVALVRYGFKVNEIYSNVAPERFVYVRQLSKLSPDTKIFSNMEPTMLYYDVSGSEADITIGKDAGYYCPGKPNIPWNSDIKPFGYQGVIDLMKAIKDALKEGRS